MKLFAVALWVTLLAVPSVILVPPAAADDVRAIVFCDTMPPPPIGDPPILPFGLACGVSVKQVGRDCTPIVLGVGECHYLSVPGGVGAGGYVDNPLIPMICPGGDGEFCYAVSAGLWGQPGDVICLARVETAFLDDVDVCFTYPT